MTLFFGTFAGDGWFCYPWPDATKNCVTSLARMFLHFLPSWRQKRMICRTEVSTSCRFRVYFPTLTVFTWSRASGVVFHSDGSKFSVSDTWDNGWFSIICGASDMPKAVNSDVTNIELSVDVNILLTNRGISMRAINVANITCGRLYFSTVPVEYWMLIYERASSGGTVFHFSCLPTQMK